MANVLSVQRSERQKEDVAIHASKAEAGALLAEFLAIVHKKFERRDDIVVHDVLNDSLHYTAKKYTPGMSLQFEKSI